MVGFYRLWRHYEKLLVHWQTTATAVTLQEIAEVLECHPRYSRVLLQSMVSRHWISWTGRVGRGAKGRLHCRVKDIHFTENPPLPPYQKNDIKQKVARAHCRTRINISFYRPIDTITPSDNTGRVERHLISMVHAGLTRINSLGEPIPDLADNIEVSNNAQHWRFRLRNGLQWHNGEPANANQLLRSVKIHLARPTFKHVTSVHIESGDHFETLVFTLSRTDSLLAYRLADPVHTLAHPYKKEVGLGKFEIVTHNCRYIRLDRFQHYHGTLPRIQEIEYNIQARLPHRKWTTLTILQPDEPADHAQRVYISEESAGFVYLAFNEKKKSLTSCQKAFVRALVRVALHSFIENKNVIRIDERWNINDTSDIAEVVSLPLSLTLGYFWSPETEILMNKIQRQLQYWNCQLILRPIDANLWFRPAEWDKCDLGVSDLRFGRPWWFSAETRFTHSIMFRHFIPTSMYSRLEKLQFFIGKDIKRYPARMQKIMQLFIKSHLIQPLFSLKFEVKVSDSIKGINVLSQGWPDFSSIYIEDNVT